METAHSNLSLETHPLDYAITACTVLQSLHRHALQGAKAVLQSSLLTPISHAEKSSEEFVKPSVINADNADLRRMLKEIDKVNEQCQQDFKEKNAFYRASLQIGGYDPLLQQKYFATADDMLREHQTLDHHRLEYILKKFEALSKDEKSGGEARLQNTFDAGDKQLELAIKKMQKKLSDIRSEIRSNISREKIETAAKTAFEKKREEYIAAIKKCRQKTLATEEKWRERDAQEHAQYMQRWQEVLNSYNKDGGDFHSKLIKNRDDINARLQQFCDKYTEYVNNHIDYRSQLPTEVHEVNANMTQWKFDTICESEEWLLKSTTALEDMYESSIDEVRAEVASLQQQLTHLHLYHMKIKHLKYVDRIFQQNAMKDHNTHRIPNDAAKYKQLFHRISNLDLGSRVSRLCDNGDVPTEERYEILLQLLFAASPDPSLLKKLNHVVRHYAR